MSNPAITKLAFRLGQANNMITELNRRFESMYQSSSDELQKTLLRNGIKELEEIELFLGNEMLEELHDFD